MISVIATIQLAEGQREAFLAEMRKIVPLVRQEKGCLQYVPSVDVETNIDAQLPVRPDVVTVVEQWETIEDLEAHLIAPHMVEYRSAVKPLVQSVSLQVLQPA